MNLGLFVTIFHTNSDIESISLLVNKTSMKCFLLSTVYRPPQASAEYTLEMQNIFSSNRHFSDESIIIGDLNIDFNGKNKRFFNDMNDKGFQQIINEKTRITESSETCIDLIFTNHLQNISGFGTLNINISDHKPVFMGRKINFQSKSHKINNHKYIEYKDWKKVNINSMFEEISELNLNFDFNQKNTNVLFEKYLSQLKSLESKYIVRKTKRIKTKNCIPWLTSDIKLAMSERDFLKKQFNELKNLNIIDDNLLITYKQKRNYVLKLIRKSKIQYYSTLFENTDNRNIWENLNKFMPTKRNEKYSKNHEIIDSEKLNIHFTRCAEDRLKSLPIDKLDDELKIDFKSNNQFSLPLVHNSLVEEKIDKLSANKSNGINSISIRFLKIISKLVVPSLTNLINKSFKEGVFPNMFKIAKVIPIFKSGDKKDPNNYRPISIQPIIGKIIETIINDYLVSYLDENKLISDKQFGFRSKHSSIDALLSIQKSILKSIDEKKKVIVITLDLYKAFDSIDHKLLLLKLFTIGFDIIAIKWIYSYLTGRYQSVNSNKKFSNTRPIKLGVFQGSVLGPILFSIFINDLSSLGCKGDLFFFADDCTLIIKAKNFKELENYAKHDLSLINNWLIKHRLLLNDQKSHYLLINLNHRPFENLNIITENIKLNRVFKTKILGITFDDRMVFDIHINSLIKKLNQKIGIFSRLWHSLPEKTLILIFKSIFMPLIDYGLVVYGFTYFSHFNRLILLHKRALKIITFSPYDIPSDPLFRRTAIQPLYQLLIFMSSIYTYRSINSLASILAKDFFKFKDNKYRTRSLEDNTISIPKHRLKCYENTIFVKGVKVFNSINMKIRFAKSLNSFRSQLLKNIESIYNSCNSLLQIN